MKSPPTLEQFIPFDPAKKLSEATVIIGGNKKLRVVIGAYDTVIALCDPSAPESDAVAQLEGQGFRVLAVAEGPKAGHMTPIGLIALSDPPR
jgi:H+-transporting ATPase